MEVQRRASGNVNIKAIGRETADFSDPESVAAVAGTANADVFINAAAYTAVDAAESDAATADTVNHLSVAALAAVAADRNIPLVHISTDYVFDGTGTSPRPPNAQTAPLGVYGRTKLLGEDAIRERAGSYAILRTSWVFSAHGSNFVKTMLRLAQTRDHLSVVDDQVGGPTPATAIADAALSAAQRLLEGQKSGTYHFAGTPDVSWLEFASEIFLQAHLDVELSGISTASYPTPAQRPLNSRLDCEGFAREFGIARPEWRPALQNVIRELALS